MRLFAIQHDRCRRTDWRVSLTAFSTRYRNSFSKMARYKLRPATANKGATFSKFFSVAGKIPVIVEGKRYFGCRLGSTELCLTTQISIPPTDFDPAKNVVYSAVRYSVHTRHRERLSDGRKA